METPIETTIMELAFALSDTRNSIHNFPIILDDDNDLSAFTTLSRLKRHEKCIVASLTFWVTSIIAKRLPKHRINKVRRLVKKWLKEGIPGDALASAALEDWPAWWLKNDMIRPCFVDDYLEAIPDLTLAEYLYEKAVMDRVQLAIESLPFGFYNYDPRGCSELILAVMYEDASAIDEVMDLAHQCDSVDEWIIGVTWSLDL